jgi:hypothetical protein
VHSFGTFSGWAAVVPVPVRVRVPVPAIVSVTTEILRSTVIWVLGGTEGGCCASIVFKITTLQLQTDADANAEVEVAIEWFGVRARSNLDREKYNSVPTAETGFISDWGM